MIAISYFIIFQIIVAQIFLNLFIAIVVDTFIGQTAAFSLPIKQNDIDTFVEQWSYFDADATGFIDVG